MTTSLLDVRDLTTRYPVGSSIIGRTRYREILHGVSFDIAPGETLGLVGESGSGKSTIGRAILRLVPVQSGTISFQGDDISAWGRSTPVRYRRAVQVVFQNPLASLNPRMLVREIIGEAVTFHRKVRGPALEAAVLELLDDVNLTRAHADRYPYELSGGQQQRVAIARSLVASPELLICDEAVSALDVSTQYQVITLLRRLQAERGLSYLFISHDLGIVRSLCDRVGVLKAGELVEIGDVRSIFEAPRHEYTRELLAAVPHLPAAPSKGTTP
jgi:ABC-type glutathione transport system ATPase component